MGQIAVGSLWKYFSYIFISSIVYLDYNQTIVLNYNNDHWQKMISVLIRASFILWTISNSLIKIEKWNIQRKAEIEVNRKLKLENELLELQIKQLKDNNESI